MLIVLWDTDREVGRGGGAGGTLRAGSLLSFMFHEGEVLLAEQGDLAGDRELLSCLPAMGGEASTGP